LATNPGVLITPPFGTDNLPEWLIDFRNVLNVNLLERKQLKNSHMKEMHRARKAHATL
jgi:hypothetical protein